MEGKYTAITSTNSSSEMNPVRPLPSKRNGCVVAIDAGPPVPGSHVRCAGGANCRRSWFEFRFAIFGVKIVVSAAVFAAALVIGTLYRNSLGKTRGK